MFWISGYFACGVLLLFMVFLEIIILSDVPTFQGEISKFYVAYITPIVGFVFAERGEGSKSGRVEKNLVVCVSLTFNLIMIGILASAFWAEPTVCGF